MSGQDDRAKQFKMDAEQNLQGDALLKEINTLRRFLFRNQDYRFTKSGQQYLYMAVMAHHGNAAAHASSHSGEEAPVLKLIDDALKMPFTVFTSAQKDKLLSVYWSLLGEGDAAKPAAAGGSGGGRILTLTVVDVDGRSASLSLMHASGEEYPTPLVVEDVDVLASVRRAFDEGLGISVRVSEESGKPPQFVSCEISDE